MAETLILIPLLGIAPSVIWLLFYLREDTCHPEPKKIILYTFFFGVLVTAFVLAFQLFSEQAISWFDIAPYSLFAITIFALIEEVFKYLAAYFAVRHKKEFDEPIDAMVYMIAAAAGFAAVENTASIFQLYNGVSLDSLSVENIILRFVGATLLHTISSGMVGYFWGEAIAEKSSRFLGVLKGLFWGTLLHVVFNYLILVSSTIFVPTLFLITAAFFLLADFEHLKTDDPRKCDI